MRRLSLVVSFISLFLGISGAQDSNILLNAYKRNFNRAEQLETKMKILQDSAETDSLEMGPLYHLAVDFVVDQSDLLLADSTMKELALLAIGLAKESEYTNARYSLWRLFTIETDMVLRIGILDTLSTIGRDDKKITGFLTEWLDTQNNLQQSGTKPDLQVVAEAVRTLGALEDKSAFSVLFTTKELGYSERISSLATQAMNSLEGDLAEFILDVLKNGSIKEKLAALKMALESESLGDVEKAELSGYALEVGMYTTTSDITDQGLSREIRFAALNKLSGMKWSKATSLAIEHFGMVLLEYDRGTASKTRMMEAVDGLGNMGTHEAAQRLTLFLELVNSYTEHGRAYDEQIVLSVLGNLKKLGDKVAFENLSYTQYLEYSQAVKKAAQDAIDNLKW